MIKIDRASIKKNPRAGAISTMIQGHQTATFEFRGSGAIPTELLSRVEITEWMGAEAPEDGTHQRGYIIDPGDADLLAQTPGISIKVDHGLQQIDHQPEPAYLFQWEDTVVQCSNCQGLVSWRDVDEDYDDEGNRFETCPLCHEQDTFVFTFEKLEDVVRETGKA